MAKLLNYVPEGNAASTADLLITLSDIPTENIVIPAGTLYETKDVDNRQQFQQLYDTTIVAGLDPPQIYVQTENSINESESFSSSSLPSQRFVLRGTPFLDDSEAITATNGGYTRVENFLSSTATDRHYIVEVTATGRAQLRFGNGNNGEIPQGTIAVSYKLGGGSDGNVDAGQITRLVGVLETISGARVVASVTNPAASSGGIQRETLASIKQKGPASTKATDRTVGKDDYEIRAVNVAGIARAAMVTSDDVAGILENRGFLYVVPDGGGAVASDTLKATVLQEVTVTFPNTITFKVTVEDPVYVPVDVGATVHFPSGYNDAAKSSVVAAIGTALTNYFKVTNDDGTENTLVNFGINYGDDMALPMSDLFCVVEGVAGVRKISSSDLGFTLAGVHSDFSLQFFEFPTLGTVTITDGDTGLVVSPS
jgi:predicted phage baseplate assembly protein